MSSLQEKIKDIEKEIKELEKTDMQIIKHPDEAKVNKINFN